MSLLSPSSPAAPTPRTSSSSSTPASTPEPGRAARPLTTHVGPLFLLALVPSHRLRHTLVLLLIIILVVILVRRRLPRLPLLGRLQRRPDRNVDLGRNREPKALSNLDQIQRVDVENLLERVARVRLEVRPEPITSRLVEEIVLGNELLKLTLDIGDSVGREGVLVQGDLGHLEEPQETQFTASRKEESDWVRTQTWAGRATGWERGNTPGQEEKQTLSNLSSSGRSSNPVDVLSRVRRRVVLDDVVDVRDVESSGGDVGAEEHA